MAPLEGYAAGLTTSVMWTFTSLLFTAAARRIEPIVVNAGRIVLAVFIHALTHRFLTGTWWPTVRSQQVLALAASGLLGLAIGDQAGLRAFLLIGPRKATLVMTLAPLAAAFFGATVLGEKLGWIAWMGILLTIGGVAWVIVGRGENPAVDDRAKVVKGVFFAMVAAVCQAAGLLLSKQGMGHGWLPEAERLAPQSATLVRMFFAAVGIAPVAMLSAWRQSSRGSEISIRDTHGRGSAVWLDRVTTPYGAGVIFGAVGTIAGPFIGVWMSLIASDRIPLGIAQTLSSLTPILILPFAAWIHEERIGMRAIVGAGVAILGLTFLFLFPK